MMNIQEITETEIRTSNLWLAAALFAKGIPVASSERQGTQPYLLVFTFPLTPRSEKVYGKFIEKTLEINMYTFYVSYQELKNLY